MQHCETEKHKYNAKTFDMHGVRNTQSSDLSIFMKTMMTMQTDLINVLVDVIKNKTIVQSSWSREEVHLHDVVLSDTRHTGLDGGSSRMGEQGENAHGVSEHLQGAVQ